jgi:hypothetical protein
VAADRGGSSSLPNLGEELVEARHLLSGALDGGLEGRRRSVDAAVRQGRREVLLLQNAA